MKPLPIALLAGIVGLGVWFWSSRGHNADGHHDHPPGGDHTHEPSSDNGNSRRLLDKSARNKTKAAADTPPGAVKIPPKKKPPSVKDEPYIAVEGLETQLMDDALAKELEIPNHPQTGKGILVTKVSPTSPAAEAALRPKDVIVIADKKPVNSMDDLREAVKGRTHTLVVFSRDGALHQVVIKPPYRGE